MARPEYKRGNDRNKQQKQARNTMRYDDDGVVTHNSNQRSKERARARLESDCDYEDEDEDTDDDFDFMKKLYDRADAACSGGSISMPMSSGSVCAIMNIDEQLDLLTVCFVFVV
jgi:hypothetical protein